MRAARWVGAWTAIVLSACAKRTSPPEKPPAAIAVDFGGCEAVDRTPSCVLRSDRAVSFLLPPGATFLDAAFVMAHETVPATTRAAGQGRRVIAPAGATALLVHAIKANEQVEWRLALRERSPEPAFVTEARAERGRGELDAAATTIAAGIDATSGEARAVAESVRGRIAIARGSSDAAEEAFRASMTSFAAAGRMSEAVDDALALVFVLLEKRRFSEVRRLLARAGEWSAGYYEGSAITRFYEGYLARDTGDVRAALPLIDRAIAQLDALDIERSSRSMRIERALTHADVGRFDEAIDALRRVEGSNEATACQRADAALNIGWIALCRADAMPGVGGAIDSVAPLERALAAYRSDCPNRGRLGNTLKNLAWAYLQAGDSKRARTSLAEARAAWTEPDPEMALFSMELDGRIDLAEGNAKRALASFDALARAAARSARVGEAWRAADGRAAALAMDGKTRAAIAASAEAERLLEEESRGVPLRDGRAEFLGARERSARRHVALLLDAHDAEGALAAARSARARVLADEERRDRIAALDAASRARWETAVGDYRAARDALAADAAFDWTRSREGATKATTARAEREAKVRAALDAAMQSLPPAPSPRFDLPAPESGTLLIAYFPLLSGWAVLTSNGVETTSARIGAIDPAASPETLGHVLFDPVHAEIARASRVRVVALGPLDAIEIHALPFDGAPLVDHAAVEYAIDLAAAPSRGSGRWTRALVVADPTGNLPAARLEGDAIALALRPHGDVTLLAGHDATRDAVQRMLAEVDLLHYAGHGAFRGRDGAESALPLAGDTSIGVTDLLALSHAPREVVLTGCDTAKRGPLGAASGIGIAHAFLAAGSEAVIAATREVGDGATFALFRALVRARAADPSRDLASALREAQREVMPIDRDATWAAFRVLRR